ncbi:hypothetical protein G4X40_20230 [Rhodococcus sp. D2-41]|uniref:hypothetical protein n=1 Tax=Speluncibacter jeojiensis TaxID=2710754 RepID=UPI00240FCD14|nr:hypothetical protein [Rhodococcus sp. D2-41]MDG3012471.1 hypothetical protein [Rhodococcus sp. D2-41]
MAETSPQDVAAAEHLREYWTHGAGAAKIRWGQPHDFDRCVTELDKYMPGRAEGYCQLLHKRALGVYAGQETSGH